MSIKSRKEKLKKVLEKSAKKEADQFSALIKKAAERSDQQSADSADFSEKLFDDLLESIKIEGLED